MDQNTFYGSNEARSGAFQAVPETCPAVNRALADLRSDIVNYFSVAEDSTRLDMIIEEAFKAITTKATIPLRKALIDAHEL